MKIIKKFFFNVDALVYEMDVVNILPSPKSYANNSLSNKINDSSVMDESSMMAESSVINKTDEISLTDLKIQPLEETRLHENSKINETNETNEAAAATRADQISTNSDDMSLEETDSD